MTENPSFDFEHLSAAERIQLAQDLRDSLGREEADWPLGAEQEAELHRRMEDQRRNPGAGLSWDEVEARIGKAIDSARAKSA